MNPASNQPSAKPRVYFVIGFIMLFVMALTWALDDSFVYTSFGAALFFFFLSYYHRVPARQQPAGRHAYTRQSHTQKNFISSLFEAFGMKGRIHVNAPSHTVDASQRLAIVIMMIVGGIFFIIVASVVFSDDPGEVEAENGLYDKAEQARYAGNYDSAEYYYRKVLAEDPENLDALNGIGIISLNRQRYDMAANQFDDALRIDPDYQYARYNKALTFYYQKNYRKSLNETFTLLRGSPDYYDAMQLAGDNYYDQQRYDSAKYWYDQGYEFGVRNAWICHVLGYLYDREGKTDKAIDLYKEALTYDDTKLDVYTRLGELLPGKEGDAYRSRASELNANSN